MRRIRLNRDLLEPLERLVEQPGAERGGHAAGVSEGNCLSLVDHLNGDVELLVCWRISEPRGTQRHAATCVPIVIHAPFALRQASIFSVHSARRCASASSKSSGLAMGDLCAGFEGGGVFGPGGRGPEDGAVRSTAVRERRSDAPEREISCLAGPARAVEGRNRVRTFRSELAIQ